MVNTARIGLGLPKSLFISFECSIQGPFLVVRGFHPSGTGCFLAGSEFFEKVVPVTDERVAIEDFAVARLARVAVDRELLLHLVGKRILQLEVGLIFSQVFDAIGIRFQVV